MKMIKAYWKQIVFVLDAVVVIALLLGYRHYTSSTAAYRASLRDQSAQIESLQTRKRQIEDDLEQLQGDYDELTRGTSYITPLFFSLDVAVLPDVVNLFRTYSWTGTMVLTAGEFPGVRGKISKQQFINYCNEGWKYCVAWDGKTDMAVYLDSMKNLLAQAEINWPNAMYFPDGTYDSAYDEMLTEAGITIIIHHGEGDLTIPTVKVSGATIEKVSGVDWYSAALDGAMLTTETMGGIMAMDVRNYYSTSEENLNDINTFFGYLGRDIANYPSTHISELPGAIDALLEEQVRKPESVAEYQQKKTAYEEELADIVDQIYQLTNKK